MTGTPNITPADLARIRARHSDIPQEALPLDIPERTTGGDEVRKRTVASVRFAKCPDHVPGTGKQEGLTGVIRGPGGVEIFRPHNKIIGNSRRIPCSGSYKLAPPPLGDSAA